MGFPVQDLEGEWHTINHHDADFIDLTLAYHRVIIDVCERWGYERILKCIKGT